MVYSHDQMTRRSNRKVKYKVCVDCGEYKPHEAFGKCIKCYCIYRKDIVKENNWKKHIESPIISCADGCGAKLHSISPSGVKVKYIKEHIHAKGERHQNWKGGRTTINGYWAIYMPDHPSAICGGYVLEHRYIMEQHIGRYLTYWEDVHHINKIID